VKKKGYVGNDTRLNKRTGNSDGGINAIVNSGDMNTILLSIAFTLIGIFLLAVSRELEREKAGCAMRVVYAMALVSGFVGIVLLGLRILGA